MRECKVVVFDLDDTLYPEHSYVRSGFAAVDQWLREDQRISGFNAVASKLFEAGRRGNIFDLALAELSVPKTEELVKKMVSIYREHFPDIILHPDADWALTALGTEYRLGLISDGYLIPQQRKVAALGLDRRIAAIVLSDLYGREHWKPSVTPYCKLIERLQCAHADCAYVSDNPAKDFVTARELGWRTIQIQRADGEYRHAQVAPEYHADHRIETLYDLPEVLRKISVASETHREARV